MMYSPFRHIDSVLWKRRPVQLTFFLTRRCNARCPFCFYLSGEKEAGEAAPELSLGEIEKMASSLDRLLWLAFSGGEIFLREDLVEIVDVFYANNKPAIILLPTNGLLPEVIYRKTRAILERCPKSTVTVKLSLDGPEQLHDRLRGTAGAFRKTLATHKLLAGLVGTYENFELGVNTVFCALNQDSMEETAVLAGSLQGVSTHTVSLIRGDVQADELKEVDMDKYRDTIARLESDLKSRRTARYRFRGGRLKAAQDILQRRFIHQTQAKGHQIIPCYAGRLTLVVTETGDVYPCESFTGKLGNVRESQYDLRRITSTRQAIAKLAAIRRGECHCTHECYMMMNVLFNPRLYPALFKEYLKLNGGD